MEIVLSFLSIVMALFMIIFGTKTIFDTRKKYYKEYLERKKKRKKEFFENYKRRK